MKKGNFNEKKPCYQVLLHQIERSLILVNEFSQLSNTDRGANLARGSFSFALSGFCHVLQSSLLTKDEKNEVRKKLEKLLPKIKPDSLEYTPIKQLLNEVCL